MYNIGGMPFLNSGVYQAMFMEAYDQVINTPQVKRILEIYKGLFEKAEDNNTTMQYSYRSAVPRLRKFDSGSTPATGGTEQGKTLKKFVYKAEQTLSREQLESSQGEKLFRGLVDGLASASALFLRDLAMDLIMNNGTCPDGTNFFSALHAFEMSGAQSNAATTAFAAGVGYETELPNFMKLKDSRGAEIGHTPNVMVVSQTLWPAAVKYFNPDRVFYSEAGTASAGMIVTPEIQLVPMVGTQDNTPSATEWYMFLAMVGARPFALYQTEDPKIDITSPEGDEYIKQGRLTVQSYWYGVVDYGPFFCGYKGNA